MATSKRKTEKAFTELDIVAQIEALIEECDRCIDGSTPGAVKLQVVQTKHRLIMDLAKVRPVEEASYDPIEAIKLRVIG